MLLARQRLISSCGQWLHGRVIYGTPAVFAHHRLSSIRVGAIQVRPKSKNSGSTHPSAKGGLQRPDAHRSKDAIKDTPARIRNARSAGNDATLQPIRPGKKKDTEVFEQLTSTSQAVFDILNWRYSRIFLALLLNSATFVVYCMWTYEAYQASQTREAIKRGETVDPSRGRFVTEADGQERFLTPGQEWLLDNFTLTPINVREGRYWTLVTSLFSHQLPMHTASNMIFCHIVCTALCPVLGTVPVALAFVIGGVSGNLMTVLWQGKRGGKSYDEKYPGQFFGCLGMSGANYAMMGFGVTAWPNWFISMFGVGSIRVGHLVIAAWLWEAFQYWRQEGWEKIQSAVISCILQDDTNEQPDGHMMGMLAGLLQGVLFHKLLPGLVPK